MKQCLWLTLAPGLLWAQTEATSALNPLNAQGIFRLEGVSLYSGYYSSGSPSGFEVPMQSPFLPGPSASAGITATFGGQKQGDKSTFSWSYSPSYFNTFYSNNQFSSYGSLNHRLGINWSRKLGAKWSLSSSVNGMIANLQQLYFNPSLLSTVAAFPASFDDLAAGMLTGKFTDAQFASLLTGAPLQSSPEQGYFYGNRVANGSANMSLSWAHSERTSLSFNVTGTRMQNISNSESGQQSGNSGLVLPQNTSVSASVAWSYSLSPRTQISIQGAGSRIFSRLQQGYETHTNLSLGHTISRRWFAQGEAGLGKQIYKQQIYQAPSAIQYLYGGSLGFKTYTQTFLVSYNRSLGDTYGLGSSTTSVASAAWTWRRPGATWSLTANGGYQELNNATFLNTRGWHAGAGITKRIGVHTTVGVQYIYVELPVNISLNGNESSQNGVSVSANWAPAQRQ